MPRIISLFISRIAPTGRWAAWLWSFAAEALEFVPHDTPSRGKRFSIWVTVSARPVGHSGMKHAHLRPIALAHGAIRVARTTIRVDGGEEARLAAPIRQ